MIGTFGGALEARKIDASNGRLRAEVRGEIESDQGVLVIRRVHVHYLLDGAEQTRETVERVHRVYAEKCPVYKTLRPAFEITSDFELTADNRDGRHSMTLQQKLDDFKAQFESGGPPYNAPKEIIEVFHRATEELRQSGLAERALKAGDGAGIHPEQPGRKLDLFR